METPALSGDDWHTRHARYEAWVRTVRDPAEVAREGVRRIVVPHGLAEYEIAPLPDGRWAAQYRLEYRTGDFFGPSSSWTACASREECVANFLAAARRHFGAQLLRTADAATQGRAREAMLKRLHDGGLFGFVEPNVEAFDGSA